MSEPEQQPPPTSASAAWARAAEAFAETLIWLGLFAAIVVIVYVNVRY